jgi:NADP-dependent 3-hydroxy acid dehydrogenase YdfG
MLPDNDLFPEIGTRPRWLILTINISLHNTGFSGDNRSFGTRDIVRGRLKTILLRRNLYYNQLKKRRNMDSKVTVITGASAGIGAALAQLLAVEGHRLVLAARRDPELKQIAGQLDCEALPVVCDVGRRADIEHLRDAALERFGQIDIWVSNAGRGINRTVLNLTDEDFDEMIAVNLKSAWYGMQAVVPHFKQRGRGHLINVSTFLSRVPFVSFRSIYSASKAALNILTANLRMDLKAQYPDIRISLVMPGIVTTDFSKNALGGPPQTFPTVRLMKSQNAEEAARAIASLIDDPRAEIYTNPALADLAVRYIQDVAAFEEYMRPGNQGQRP